MTGKSYSTYYHVGETFAGLSGAVIGFINEDVPGIFAGWDAGRELYRYAHPKRYVQVGSGPSRPISRAPAQRRKRKTGSAPPKIIGSAPPKIIGSAPSRPKPVSGIKPVRRPRFDIPDH